MISPHAYIDKNAKIGKGVIASPFAVIYGNVEIGEGTWIGPHATIMEGARIGKNCKIFPGAVIAAIPQDLKFSGEESVVEIGDNTTIREFVTINRGTRDRMKTVVGSNCLLMAYVHVAHDCIIGDNVILVNNVTLAGHITIENFAILEGLVAVQQFIHIGTHSFVTGGCLVRKNIPPFVKAAREPLAFIGVNSVGLKRRGFSNEVILQIEDIYRIIYLKGYNVSNALALVEEEVPESPEKEIIIGFIRNSKDGIIRGATA
jgi:UDP-N-acetylglucosamine acyltransferase